MIYNSTKLYISNAIKDLNNIYKGLNIYVEDDPVSGGYYRLRIEHWSGLVVSEKIDVDSETELINKRICHMINKIKEQLVLNLKPAPKSIPAERVIAWETKYPAEYFTFKNYDNYIKETIKKEPIKKEKPNLDGVDNAGIF